MTKLFFEGGFIMYPLLICSILIWAVVIEKYLFLKKFVKKSNQLHTKLSGMVAEKRYHEASGLCNSYHPVVASPYLALISGETLSREKRLGRIERRIAESRLGARRFLWILGTIGASAPFIGLFGTVVGIIKSFESIASTGKSGFAVVAAGLSEALIATAAGIIVAVIAVIFYNYFQVRLKNIILVFSNQIEDLLDQEEGS